MYAFGSFFTGKFYDSNNADWVPSLKMRYNKSDPQTEFVFAFYALKKTYW